jgi:hypothetical protein
MPNIVVIGRLPEVLNRFEKLFVHYHRSFQQQFSW